MDFSLNSLITFKELIRFKLKYQKQFESEAELENLLRLDFKLNSLIKEYTKKVFKEYDF